MFENDNDFDLTDIWYALTEMSLKQLETTLVRQAKQLGKS